MKKRLFVLVLCLIFIAAAFPLTVQAEEAPRLDSNAYVEQIHRNVRAERSGFSAEAGTITFDETFERPDGEPSDTEEEYPTRAANRIQINATNFPDAVFRDLLLKTFKNGYITNEEAGYITQINVTGMGIANLKGIEFFPNLEMLYCGAAYDNNGNITAKNNLKSLTVSCFPNLKTLVCDYNQLTKLDVSKTKSLEDLACEGNKLSSLDLRGLFWFNKLYAANNALTSILFDVDGTFTEIDCSNNKLTSLKLGDCIVLMKLYCENNRLTSLDVSAAANPGLDVICMNNKLTSLKVSKWIENLLCGNNQLKKLDLSGCEYLSLLDCSYNQIQSLDLSGSPELKGLGCVNNCLVSLDLENNPKLEELYCYGQKCVSGPLTESDGKYTFDIHKLSVDPSRVFAEGTGVTYDAETGVFTFPKAVSEFEYAYDTGSIGEMEVTVCMPYTGKATVKLNDKSIQYKGSTPYVIYNGKAFRPAFKVYDEKGKVIDPIFYTYQYEDNQLPGTARIKVRFIGSNKSCSTWFKIYLPATKSTTVQNVGNGIKVSWEKVDQAKGYVIYRRAWNLKDAGWTTFERWNNTKQTTWTDTKVYAGTRYQYGIKAYFEDPMDNYNLGVVGPLKTTVRITTRTLTKVDPGKSKLIVYWQGSSLFTGYQVQVATDANFKNDLKTVTINKPSTYQKTISGLKSKTTYYVRVRSYHVFDGTTYYGQWSNVLNTKTK